LNLRFRIEVSTLDGKLSYERETPADALEVAEGGKQSLGVSIIDNEGGRSYSVEEFRRRFAS
jgi:hypothetical protein